METIFHLKYFEKDNKVNLFILFYLLSIGPVS